MEKTDKNCPKCNKSMKIKKDFFDEVLGDNCFELICDCGFRTISPKNLVKVLEDNNKKLKRLLTEAENKLDQHNGDYGTQDKLCLCCGADDYDSIQGVLHYPNCIIRRIRELE